MGRFKEFSILLEEARSDRDYRDVDEFIVLNSSHEHECTIETDDDDFGIISQYNNCRVIIEFPGISKEILEEIYKDLTPKNSFTMKHKNTNTTIFDSKHYRKELWEYIERDAEGGYYRVDDDYVIKNNEIIIEYTSLISEFCTSLLHF